MKLLYANNYLYRRGGSERVMFDEAGWFASHGHEAYFFGHRHAETEVMQHASLFPEPVDYSAVRGLARVRAAARIVYNADAARRLGRLLDATRPDLIHCHNIYAGLTPAILDEASKHGIPAILTLHDYKLACPSYLMLHRGKVCEACVGHSFLNCVARRCHKDSVIASAVTTVESMFNAFAGKWARARLYVCPSKFVQQIMIRHGYPREKLRHVANGVDVGQWSAASSGDHYALYVGRLSAEKGVETLVRACVGLALPLRIVGGGPERQRLEQIARELGAKVQFDGHRTAAELQASVQGAAYLVVPSIWYENAPMAILETMAAGKPVIASSIGGIPELVEDGVTGVLVPPGDVERLRDAMQRLAAESRLRREMGKVARMRAEANFSLDVHANHLAAVYQEALAA